MGKTIYRADHCGSLVRPPKLRTARKDYLHGRIAESRLRGIEDECVADALQLQREAGLQIYSDGEFRRDFWLSAVSDTYFEGMKNEGIDFTRHAYLRGKEIKEQQSYVPPNPIVTGKLARKK